MTKTSKIIVGLFIALAGTAGLGVAITSNTPVAREVVTVSVAEAPATRALTSGEIKISVQNLELDESNSVRLTDPINQRSVAKTLNALERLRRSGATEVYLLIDSPGGGVVEGNRLVGYIEASPVPINTVCMAICASMGAHIHQAGAKRLMTSKAILMFHPASGGSQGTVEGMHSQIEMFQRYMDRMDAKAAQRAKMDYDKFKLLVLKEYWIETQDAVANNLTDGVVNLLTFEPEPASVGVFGGGGEQVDKPKETKRKFDL